MFVVLGRFGQLNLQKSTEILNVGIKEKYRKYLCFKQSRVIPQRRQHEPYK